jgi:hypothetical protein
MTKLYTASELKDPAYERDLFLYLLFASNFFS